MSQRFFSAKLTADLFCKRITLLGTVHKTSQKFRLCLMPVRGDLWDQACFFSPQKQARVSYVQKKNKAVVLLCSMFDKKLVDEVSGKTDDSKLQQGFCGPCGPTMVLWNRIPMKKKNKQVPESTEGATFAHHHLITKQWTVASHFQAVALHC